MKKVYYVRRTEEVIPKRIFVDPWVTPEGVYRSQMCWYSGNKDLTIIDPNTNEVKRFCAELDEDGNVIDVTELPVLTEE